jgi:prolyl oligopeptidase
MGGTMPREGHSYSGASDLPGDYPEAERLDLVEVMHGHPVADPYRWLEDSADPRTQQWCARQDDLFSAWQAHWLGHEERERLRNRLTALADAGAVSVAVWRGEPGAGWARTMRCC